MATLWLRGERATDYWRQGLMLLAPTVFLAAPWFWAVIQQQPDFAEYFFWRHHVTRFVQGLNHEQPFWYYVPVIAVGMFPCSLLLPALLYYVVSRRERLRRYRTVELGFVMMAGLWPVLFFSISRCKLPTYILPAIPMLCLGVGKMLADTVWTREPIAFFRRYSDSVLAFTTFISLLACIAAGIASSVLGRSNSTDLILSVTFVVLPMLWFIGYLWSGRQLLRPSWPFALTVALLSGAYGLDFVIAEFADWRSLANHAAQIQQEQSEDAPIVYFGRSSAGARFSIKSSPIVHFEQHQLEECLRFVANQPLAIVVTDRSSADDLLAASGRDFRIEPSASSRRIFVSRSTVPDITARANATMLR
jgi:4-amino-4-deoxy-L-arabinose transferase-like glycosyltransferase